MSEIRRLARNLTPGDRVAYRSAGRVERTAVVLSPATHPVNWAVRIMVRTDDQHPGEIVPLLFGVNRYARVIS